MLKEGKGDKSGFSWRRRLLRFLLPSAVYSSQRHRPLYGELAANFQSFQFPPNSVLICVIGCCISCSVYTAHGNG